jgi:hypothetical protein
MGDSLQCLAPPGSNTEALVSIRINNVTSIVSRNDTLIYTPPLIQSITAGTAGSGEKSVAAVPQYGGGWISIKGRDLVRFFFSFCLLNKYYFSLFFFSFFFLTS